MKRKSDKRKRGFTLVELLTTLAVIGILLGLLIPALNEVSKFATRVRQKAQFHAIGVALEAFRNDYGDYPPSETKDGAEPFAVASHHLAEALIGQDGFGFHPRSEFRADGLADWDGDGARASDETLYDSSGSTYETAAENLAARKGPYLELENANAVKLGNIYPDPGDLQHLAKNSYVLVDMYKQLKNTATRKEVGMPILYYKANKLKTGNDPADWANNTYNLNDSFFDVVGGGSWGIVTCPKPGYHPLADPAKNADIFYNAIQNPNFTSPPRPYRSESFILQSAGPDGLYGTIDDVFNFESEK